MKSKIILGTSLILVGAISITSQFITIGDNFILSILAIMLLTIYLGLGGNKKYSNIGFIIGACVIPAIQIADYLEIHRIYTNLEGTITFTLLAIAFSIVYFVHTLSRKEISFSKRHWPGITSLILLSVAILTFTVEYFNWSFGNMILHNGGAITIIIIGLSLISKNITNKSNIKTTTSYK